MRRNIEISTNTSRPETGDTETEYDINHYATAVEKLILLVV